MSKEASDLIESYLKVDIGMTREYTPMEFGTAKTCCLIALEREYDTLEQISIHLLVDERITCNRVSSAMMKNRMLLEIMKKV